MWNYERIEISLKDVWPNRAEAILMSVEENLRLMKTLDDAWKW
jgi:hypothetical protein